MRSPSSLDARVRLAVYHTLLETGAAPSASAIAATAGFDVGDVRASLERLAAAHVLVLHPGSSEVWMAMPFSAVPTAFRVEADAPDGAAGAWWANCAWDALGIAAMLHGAGHEAGRAPIHITTTCPDCEAPIALTVRPEAGDDAVTANAAGTLCHGAQPVVHFAVPASQWWDDIGFT
jgi:hypothetical protein